MNSLVGNKKSIFFGITYVEFKFLKETQTFKAY